MSKMMFMDWRFVCCRSKWMVCQFLEFTCLVGSCIITGYISRWLQALVTFYSFRPLAYTCRTLTKQRNFISISNHICRRFIAPHKKHFAGRSDALRNMWSANDSLFLRLLQRRRLRPHTHTHIWCRFFHECDGNQIGFYTEPNTFCVRTLRTRAKAANRKRKSAHNSIFSHTLGLRIIAFWCILHVFISFRFRLN